MVLPPYPRVARHAATAVVAARLHSHHLVIHASIYLSSRSYHSSLHSCTCITHSVALLRLVRSHSSISLTPIYPGCIHPCDSHSLPSFTHLRIDLIWMQLKNYEGRTAADYLRVHNTWRYVHTHACERTAIHSRCGWLELPHGGRRQWSLRVHIAAWVVNMCVCEYTCMQQ